jgi:hypothetical protein
MEMSGMELMPGWNSYLLEWPRRLPVRDGRPPAKADFPQFMPTSSI